MIADDLLAEVPAVPVAFSVPAVAGGEHRVTPDMPEVDVLVATHEGHVGVQRRAARCWHGDDRRHRMG